MPCGGQLRILQIITI